MGAGDRLLELELNLEKIWVLVNFNYFNNQTDSKMQKLKSKIKEYFQTKTSILTFDSKMSKIRDIETTLDEIKKSSNIDLISIVSAFECGIEENGGAHYVKTNGQRYVFPDP